MRQVFAIFDFMGPENEAEEAVKVLQNILEEKIELTTGTIFDLFELSKNKRFDIVVVDFGGLLPGADGLIRSVFRDAYNWADDHPSSYVIIWSSVSWSRWAEEVQEEFGELRNFFLYDGSENSRNLIRKLLLGNNETFLWNSERQSEMRKKLNYIKYDVGCEYWGDSTVKTQDIEDMLNEIETLWNRKIIEEKK